MGGLANIGLRAMAAQFAGLQTTGNNIANAAVKGYSRQEIQVATSNSLFKGGSYYGTGVSLSSIARAHDELLTRESGNASALSSMDAARLTQLQGLEKVFQSGTGGIGDATSQLFKAMSDVSSNPGDLASRRVALARADDLATRFNTAGSALEQLQTGVTTSLNASVIEINSLAQSIGDVNQKIASLRLASNPPNELLDQRDSLIAQLSTKIGIGRIDASDGTTSITIAGGQALVLAGNAARLQVVQDAADPSRGALAIMNGSVPRKLDPHSLGGGEVTGLLQFQNQDLVQGRNLIGRLATAIGTAVNAQQQRGITLQPPLGQVTGAPIYNLGAPVALPNAGNVRDAGGVPLGSVTLTVTGASALKASEYDLREGGAPGSWQLTRLSDGSVSTVASGDVVDGLRIDINTPQAGDRYLLQPLARAAQDMGSAITDPRDLAAASPLVASTAAANIGTAQVASLQVTSVPLPTPGASVQISFTDNNGGYDWNLLDASSNVIGGGSGAWVAGQTLPPPPQDFNGFMMQISGVPRSGDVLSVAPISASAVSTHNGNALSMMNLQDALVLGGQTATDSWAQAIADVGVRVQTSKTAARISQSVADQAEQARSSQAGVNLDEEASRLIQYQQGYQAAAKILSVAQTIFDTLLQTAAR